jgi:Cysteinyl-tRNA synthetase
LELHRGGGRSRTSGSPGLQEFDSLGNFYTLRDLLERGYAPLAIRYLLLSVPYRQKLNFTFDGLKGAHSAVERIANTLRRLHTTPAASGPGDLEGSAVDAARWEFMAAMADDLNTARALAATHTLLTRVNQALDGGGIAPATRARLEAFFALLHQVLGVAPALHREPGEDEAAITALIAERAEARGRRDFARADDQAYRYRRPRGGARYQLLFPLVRVNFELGVIMVIAVSCVKLLSAHNSTQHTSRKHKV